MRGYCEEVYIGETARPFGVRFREHVNSTRVSMTAVGDHLRIYMRCALCGKGRDTFKRKIREAIEIHFQDLTLNYDAGYELPAIYQPEDVLSCDFLST